MRRPNIGPLLLTWLIAFNLRSILWAMPPALPAIKANLHLGLPEVGLLGSLPAVCLAAGAIPGALVVRWRGFRLAVGVALLGLGFGAVGRVIPPAAVWLIIGTAAFSLSIAMVQPAMAVLIRAWFPEQIHRVVTVYVNGLSMGALVASVITPFLVVEAGWRFALAFWSLPAAAVAALWFAGNRRGQVAPRAHANLWLPALRDQEVWRAAALFGAQNLAFSTVFTWVPFLPGNRQPAHLAGVLLAMNVSIIGPTLWLGVTHRTYLDRPAFYVLAAACAGVGTLGLSLGVVSLEWELASLVGLGTGLAGIAALTLPSARGESADSIAVYSSLMLALGYALSFAGPFAGGLIVQYTQHVPSAFYPALAACLAMGACGLTFVRTTFNPRASAPGDTSRAAALSDGQR
ncbi:MAG: MFS transporter [Candidatus Dormiibacterota bacterium]